MLSKCCCCVPLRTGSLVLGILGILGAIEQFAQPSWGNVVVGMFYLNASGALLFGAIKYNAVAVLVNLVCTANIIVLELVLAIVAISQIVQLSQITNGLQDQQAIGYQQTVLVTNMASCIVGAVLNAYFWVCNYSFYKELKGGNENPA